MKKYEKYLIKYAKKLRKEMTDAERHLWKFLKDRQFEGYKFRRQQPIGKYIVDFVNFERKLIIELDGGQHFENEKDKEREGYLRKQGYKILRFWDNEVLKNIEGVLDLIRDELEKHPSPHPSPPRGEGIPSPF